MCGFRLSLMYNNREIGIRFRALESASALDSYYYRARYYDFQSGKFLSEDPINFRAGINFYTYVYNVPTRFRDPKGKDPVIGVIVGGVVGAVYGGIGAAVQGGSWADIGRGALFGGVVGGAVGLIDPAMGVGVLALYAGGGAFVADLGGQVLAGGGVGPCKPINWGSAIGAGVGGAIGGALTPALTTFAAGGSEVGQTVFVNGTTGMYGFGFNAVGAIAGLPRTPCGCPNQKPALPNILGAITSGIALN